MIRKTWHFRHGGRAHRVDCARTVDQLHIRADGAAVNAIPRLSSRGTVYSFKLGGAACALTERQDADGVRLVFTVEGRVISATPVAPGRDKPLEAIPPAAEGASLFDRHHQIADRRAKGARASFRDVIPDYTWIVLVVTLAIIPVGHYSAASFVAGLLGSAAVLLILTRTTLRPGQRQYLSVMIPTLVWSGYILLGTAGLVPCRIVLG